MLESALKTDLAKHEQQHLRRKPRRLSSPQQAYVVCEGRELLAFANSDYLGLANHPLVKEAFKQGVDRYGVGSGASQIVCGFTDCYAQLQQALADWLGYERVLLFSSGYLANLGVITTLLNQQDCVLQDRLNHASLLDAAKLSGAKQWRFLHADANSLEQRILMQQQKSRRCLAITEGVFSMDGDIAPLTALSQVCAQYQIPLMLDDAHGLGVIGSQGRGTVAAHDLNAESVPILMGTFSKAFGSMGAFVAGSQTLIESLTQFARSYTYTTALPPAVMVANLAALQLVKDDTRREALQALIAYFRQCAEQAGLVLSDSTTPIQPLIIGSAEKALAVNNALFEKGLLVGLMRPPSVPKQTSRLRIIINATHNKSHIDQLIDAIVHCGYDLC